MIIYSLSFQKNKNSTSPSSLNSMETTDTNSDQLMVVDTRGKGCELGVRLFLDTPELEP